jgi:hypothetical protein
MKSKCPCCGNDLEYRHELKAYVCDECQFRCPSLFLPRVAAAMELAQAEVNALKAYHVPLERLDAAMEAADGMVEQARERVIEVFGGE